MRALIIVLNLLLVLSACSQGESSHSDQQQFKDENEARKVLTGDQVVCKGLCPEYVGGFYLYHQRQDGTHWVNLCSATLVAPNQVLTNKHCIEDILKEGDLCNDKASIEIKFPKIGTHPFEVFKCTKILKTSKDYYIPGYKDLRRRNVPDWALIEIDVASSPTLRKPIGLTAGSVERNVNVDLFPVYFDKTYEQPKGTILPALCKLSLNERNIYAGESESPLFELRNCNPKLIHGNSGSGVFLHGQNQLLGVMATGDESGQNNSGTMAHCIPNFSKSADDCLFTEDKSYTEIMKAIFYLRNIAQDASVQIKEDVFKNPTVRFGDSMTLDDMDKINITFQAPWSDYLNYLKNQGSERWRLKLQLALAKILFLRNPLCVESSAIANDKLSLPIGNLNNWNFLNSFELREIPKKSAEGELQVKTESHIPNNSFSLKLSEMNILKKR